MVSWTESANALVAAQPAPEYEPYVPPRRPRREFRLHRNKKPKEPQYEVYEPPNTDVMCRPSDINEIAGYWRCGYCREECPMTCPFEED